jgi:TetR/AcrR family transcriptional repressor of nem operon
MGRPKAFDRDQALDAAIGVFREHGFEGTSADMLVAAMKIGRQSLYDTFGDKWRLYCEAVSRYCKNEVLAHRAELRRGPRAIDGLAAMIERVTAEAEQACLGVGSICEFGRAREALNSIHTAADRSLSAMLVEQIRRAKTEGDIAEAIDPDAGARFLAAHIAGIRVAARGGAGPEALASLGQLALRALR